MTLGYVYVTENLLDGEIYVGQSTRLDPENVRNYLGSGDYLLNSIREHGRENFRKHIIGYYDTREELDYAEVLQIATARAEGASLLNGGVGGPRAHGTFVGAMMKQFGVAPFMFDEWLATIRNNPEEVSSLIALGHDVSSDRIMAELEMHFRQTQDLTLPCPSCGSPVDEVCRTKTGNAAKNHAARNKR